MYVRGLGIDVSDVRTQFQAYLQAREYLDVAIRMKSVAAQHLLGSLLELRHLLPDTFCIKYGAAAPLVFRLGYGSCFGPVAHWLLLADAGTSSERMTIDPTALVDVRRSCLCLQTEWQKDRRGRGDGFAFDVGGELSY